MNCGKIFFKTKSITLRTVTRFKLQTTVFVIMFVGVFYFDFRSVLKERGSGVTIM